MKPKISSKGVLIFLLLVGVLAAYVWYLRLGYQTNNTLEQIHVQNVSRPIIRQLQLIHRSGVHYTTGTKLHYINRESSKVHPVTQKEIRARPFVLSERAVEIIERLSQLDAPVSSVGDYDWNTLPMVVGASSNHYTETLTAIELQQKLFPRSHLYFYDLGLNVNETNEIHRFCNVTYMKFNFAMYPKHVRDLRNYAFKSLIWQEMLLLEERFLWMDSSVRFQPCFMDVLRNVSSKLSDTGMVMLHRSVMTIYSSTAPTFYDYFNTNISQANHTMMYGGGLVLFQRHSQMIADVMKWMVLCALEQSCQQPPGATSLCDNARLPPSDEAAMGWPYIDCHRYDNSALAILQGNAYGYQLHRYSISRDACVIIQRHGRQAHHIRTCS